MHVYSRFDWSDLSVLWNYMLNSDPPTRIKCGENVPSGMRKQLINCIAIDIDWRVRLRTEHLLVEINFPCYVLCA